MQIESGYHKLRTASDWTEIEASGSFSPSIPAERHWLGEGVYFFLDPNGLKWATKWPFKGDNAGKTDGIVLVSLDTSGALDIRNVDIMSQLRTAINLIRPAIIKKHRSYSDGAALAYLFKSGALALPTCVIANFDMAGADMVVFGSRFLLKPTYCLPPYSNTTQIQACVIDQDVIKSMELHNEFSAL